MPSILGRRLRGNREFGKFWLADAVSIFGSRISTLAIPTVAILGLNAGPLGVGILGALQELPLLLLSMISGVIADRSRNPRRLMVVCNLVSVAAMGSIPVAALTGRLTLVQLDLVTLLSASAEQLVEVSLYSVMPSIVRRDGFGDANARLESTRQVANVAGPGVAGLLIQVIGAARAVTADAISFLAAALVAIRLRLPSRPPHPTVRPSFRSDLAVGARLVFGDRRLRHCALASATGNLGSHIFFAVELLFLYRNVGFTPGEIGLIATLTGVLSPVLALNTGLVTRRLGLGMTLAACSVLLGLGCMALPLAVLVAPIPIVAFEYLMQAVESGLWNVSMITLRQSFTPDELFGRMVATTRTVAQGTSPLALLLGGVLGSLVGLVPTLLIGGIITAGSGLFLVDPELLRAGRGEVHPELQPTLGAEPPTLE